MPSPFPYNPVIRECLWKKTKIGRKKMHYCINATAENSFNLQMAIGNLMNIQSFIIYINIYYLYSVFKLVTCRLPCQSTKVVIDVIKQN